MFRYKISLGKKRKGSLCRNIITPDTIPNFCIPPKDPWQGDQRGTSSRRPAPSLKRHPGHGRELLKRELTNPHAGEVPLDRRCSYGMSTNADPQSQAALSMPHLAKVHTCYGFCTLLEVPHTRRKESLFHDDPSSRAIPLVLPREHPGTFPRDTPSSSSTLSTFTWKLLPRTCPQGGPALRNGDSASSSDSSPFGFPLLFGSASKPRWIKVLLREKQRSGGVPPPAGGRTAPTPQPCGWAPKASTSHCYLAKCNHPLEPQFGF